jgi:DNA-binding MarR family transcriptional regulator
MHANPDGTEWTPQTPAETVLHAFMRIGRRMKQPGEMHDHSAIAALHTLRCNGAVRLSELASLIELDASTASRLVRTLEIAGLVDRAPDPEDRRASRIVMTEAGAQRLDEFSRGRKELLTKAMHGWRKSDIETFATLMGRFADGVTQIADERTRTEATTRRIPDKENR